MCEVTVLILEVVASRLTWVVLKLFWEWRICIVNEEIPVSLHILFTFGSFVVD